MKFQKFLAIVFVLSYMPIIDASQKPSSQEKPKLLFSRLPKEIRFENLRIFIAQAKTPEEAQAIIIAAIEGQGLLLDAREIKELLKIMWSKFKTGGINNYQGSYFDVHGIRLLDKVPSLEIELKKVKDEQSLRHALTIKEMEKYLKEGVDINAQASDGNTALMIASVNNKPDIVKFLLEHGADPNIKNDAGNTALYLLGAPSANKQILELLLSHDANPNVKMAGGKTPLFLATMRYNADPDLVKLLLDSGADRSIPDNAGITPLEWIQKQPVNAERSKIIVLLKNYQPEKKKP